MIDVSHLSKYYPGVHAVRDVSFSVEAGEVVGFLGPNGAGKSTTMRVLSGYISPTGGEVRVAGLDVTRDSLRVRRRLGYLPESCPLYTEMRVREYLKYRGALKGVSHRHLRNRVDKVMEQCGLVDVGRRCIGVLSKGYRQRVGIADALVHNPDLLILDEPTIGLDPNQILHIRQLIRELADEHTILMSTHILSEVEAVCKRVIVLHRGEILESAPLADLEKRWCNATKVRAEVRAPAEELAREVRALEGNLDCGVETREGWCFLEAAFDAEGDPREALARLFRDKGWDLRELHREKRGLEEVFVNMTSGMTPAKGGGQ